MPNPASPEDRPDPNDNMPAVRARIPDHVAKGELSTGVIVVTGGTEFVLDFVRNLPRPNAIVARVVLPHMVMPQFIEALSTNIELYRQRYGDLPGAPPLIPVAMDSHIVHAGVSLPSPNPPPPIPSQPAPALPNSEFPSVPQDHGPAPTGNPYDDSTQTPDGHAAQRHEGSNTIDPGGQSSGGTVPQTPPKRQNPQDIYDELKIRDEILSGAYANAIMIGHGPYEFSFDFITNFYPQSAVSCRVYLAAGHVWRMLDSLKQSWEQLRPRLGFPPPPTG